MLAGVPLVFHSLTMANFGTGFGVGGSAIFQAAERLVGRWTDAYFVVGDDLRQRYARAGIGSEERYHVVRSAVDTARFRRAGALSRAEARRQLGLDPSRRLVAYVGSLEARKGVLELPSFLSLLRDTIVEPVSLLLAGDGELRCELEQRLEVNGLTRDTIFLGHTSEVPLVLAAADCLVLLSRSEGLPQVFIQAASAGTPFVAYPVDGTNEAIAMGLAGRVVAFGDLAAAASAARDLMLSPRPQPVDLLDWHPLAVRRHFQRLFCDLVGQADGVGQEADLDAVFDPRVAKAS
jgi:glycosyltransferase involved in cell wall biosynthesis